MIRTDPNELKWHMIWKLSPFQPNYWGTLFKYSKAFFDSMGKQELIKELDEQIRVKIEERMGARISYVLMVYENMWSLNSCTRSQNPQVQERYIYKYTIREWLTEIEDWIFEQMNLLESEIRFTRVKDLL